MPRFALNHDEFVTILAVLGTTISPYLFFWQAAEEAEDELNEADPRPLREHPRDAAGQMQRIGVDTWTGMTFSNLVALAIVFGTAATLHANGITNIDTAAQAASALRPIAGPFAEVIFAAGIFGTGLLAVPTLAGSAGYAVGEALELDRGTEPAGDRGARILWGDCRGDAGGDRDRVLADRSDAGAVLVGGDQRGGGGTADRRDDRAGVAAQRDG